MKVIKASEFKVDCVLVVGEVSAGEAVVVVKNGKARGVFAHARSQRRAVFGADKGRLRILGDIVSPMPEAWEWTPGRDVRRG